jgi:hypothetical protein
MVRLAVAKMKWGWRGPLNSLALVGLVSLFIANAAAAASFPNSLWIGTDNINTRAVLNTDTAGNVLRSVLTTDATGFGVDLASNIVYFGASSAVITPRNLTTLVPGTPFTPSTGFSEDMTFDGAHLWRCSLGPVSEINPADGAILSSFYPGFQTMGIAWDGSDLWISQFTYGGIVARYTTAGVATAESFNVDSGILPGGLGYDPRDGTLYLGTYSKVYHYTTAGLLLGSFDIPANQDPNRFVDGLEFQGAAVPLPPSLVLFGSGLLGLGGWRRFRKG